MRTNPLFCFDDKTYKLFHSDVYNLSRQSVDLHAILTHIERWNFRKIKSFRRKIHHLHMCQTEKLLSDVLPKSLHPYNSWSEPSYCRLNTYRFGEMNIRCSETSRPHHVQCNDPHFYAACQPDASGIVHSHSPTHLTAADAEGICYINALGTLFTLSPNTPFRHHRRTS